MFICHTCCLKHNEAEQTTVLLLYWRAAVLPCFTTFHFIKMRGAALRPALLLLGFTQQTTAGTTRQLTPATICVPNREHQTVIGRYYKVHPMTMHPARPQTLDPRGSVSEPRHIHSDGSDLFWDVPAMFDPTYTVNNLILHKAGWPYIMTVCKVLHTTQTVQHICSY